VIVNGILPLERECLYPMGKEPTKDHPGDLFMSGKPASAAAFVEEVGALALRLAKSHDNPQLLKDTQTFIDGVRVKAGDGCAACADRLSRSAFAEAVMPRPIERPAQDRRSDFLLRMVVAFHPAGVADKPEPGDLALPRHALGRYGGFLREILGSLTYADLNAEASRLLSRFPNVPDRGLRDALYGHAPSRVLLMKVLVRLLNRFADLDTVGTVFQARLRCDTWPTVFRPGPKHFAAVCDGLFGEFAVQLQTPREGDDLDAWFGLGATERVLDLLDGLAAPPVA
jgi:hypothetical protein